MPTIKEEVSAKKKKGDSAMSRINENYVGESLDDFLAEQGMLEEVRAEVYKFTLARKIKLAMRKKHINKTEMAKKIHTTKEEVDKLLSPTNRSIDINVAIRAATALGIHHTLSS